MNRNMLNKILNDKFGSATDGLPIDFPDDSDWDWDDEDDFYGFEDEFDYYDDEEEDLEEE